MAKATAKQFKDIFIPECQKWIKRFGQIGWDIRFVYKEDDADRAWTSGTLPDRNVQIGLSTDPSVFITGDKEEIIDCARHEALELLFVRYDTLAKERRANNDELDEARHEIIATLENVLFDNLEIE